MGLISSALAQAPAATQAAGQAAANLDVWDTKTTIMAFGIGINLLWNIFNTWRDIRLSRDARRRDVRVSQFETSIAGPLRSAFLPLTDFCDSISAISSHADKATRRKQFEVKNLEVVEQLTKIKNLCGRIDKLNHLRAKMNWSAMVDEREDAILSGFDTCLNSSTSDVRFAAASEKLINDMNDMFAEFEKKITTSLEEIVNKK